MNSHDIHSKSSLLNHPFPAERRSVQRWDRRIGSWHLGLGRRRKNKLFSTFLRMVATSRSTTHVFFRKKMFLFFFEKKRGNSNGNYIKHMI